MYNLTDLYAATTVSKLVVYANDVTSGLLAMLFIWAVFFIMLMVMKRYEFDSALLTSSLVCFILSVMFNYMQLIPSAFMYVFLLLSGLTGVYVFLLK